MNLRTCYSICATMLLLSMLGCGADGPELAPLSGQVTLDGEPVAEAALMFTPVAGGRPAQAVTDAEGRFEAWTLEPGDGAIVGEHRVAVTQSKLVGIEATEAGLEGVSSGPVRVESAIPAKYGRADSSGLTAQVDSGEDNYVELSLLTSDREVTSGL